MQSSTTPKQAWQDPALFERAGAKRRSWMEDVAKRALDIGVSLVLIVLLAPFVLIAGGADQARFAGTGILPRAAPGERWQDIPDSQVPHDVRATGKLCGTTRDGGGR